MPDRPLRILQVLRSPIGGLYRHVIDVSTALAARGHELGLVMDNSLSDAQTAARLDMLAPHLALGVHKMPIPRLLGASDLTVPFRLKRLARQYNINVLHGHGAKGGFHARLARMGSRKQVAIYTPHGGVLHFDQDRLAGKMFLQIENLLLGQTDAIVFESQFARQSYSARIKAPPCPAPVIHNGLAEAEFVPVPARPEARDFGFVGELRDLKGILLLLEALAPVAHADGRPATLVVAGDGPQRDEVVAMIGKLGLGERVTLVGVRPAREVFSQARCIVVPSLAESLPYIVLEAAAAAKPVIATGVGGIGEIFGPTAGALVRPGNVEVLQHALQHYLDDEAAAKAEMHQRLQHVRSSFSLERMTTHIETLYREAFSQR